MRAILIDKSEVLNPLAGTADPTEGGPGMNPLAALLQNDQEIKDALNSLPEGTKRSVEVKMTLEKDRSDHGGEMIEPESVEDASPFDAFD